MKKHHMPEMKEGGVNVTPLIDVVMCLIVFFMLMTKLGVSRGIDKDIKLPSAILGAKIEDMGDTLSLNVHVRQTMTDPQVTAQVNGASRELPIYDPASHTKPLEVVLTEFKRLHKDKTRIIIRGDQDLPYSQLEKVLISVSNANISDTAYETKPGTGDEASVSAQ